MSKVKERPKPFVFPEYCKGCGRCIEACPKHCIEFGKEINPATGLIPIVLKQELCNGCQLCIEACPEPYGLQIMPDEFKYELLDPKKLFGDRMTDAPDPEPIPDTYVPLPKIEPLVVKGNYAASIGAILAGCRHFFGYPITPSTEGAELMAKFLPMLDGVYIQAVSEVATVNLMYGCGGAGLPCMTFTSSPGMSLMLEGISYMIGAQVPGVFVDVMRGGPGLGNIAPEQSDIKLVCRGLGHGNTHAIVLAPSTCQEMLDLAILAFELSFKYRNPVIMIPDGYLGQMTGKVVFPDKMVKPGIPQWAVYGDRMHRKNLICSIELSEQDLENHNKFLNEKYRKMIENEQRAETYFTDDAEILLVGCNTPARMAKGAVQELRQQGIKAGLFRPITVWPFPTKTLLSLIPKIHTIVMVEASNRQLEDELRLELSNAGVTQVPRIERVNRYGGMLPQQSEIIEKVLSLKEVRS